jgi:hypothetical protein
MTVDTLSITPETKVASLLDRFPQLEEPLISMAKPFEKLRNPILRNSVAKVASLRQAAAVAGIPTPKLVNALRALVGQEPLESRDMPEEINYFVDRPDWLDLEEIADSLDEATDLTEDQMPIGVLLKRCNRLEPGQVLEFRTSFPPIPGLDLMQAKGFQIWCRRDSDEVVLSYLRKPKE